MTTHENVTGWVLRAFTDADAEHLVGGFRDPAVALWNPGPEDGDAAEWAVRGNDWSDRSHATWAVGDVDGTLLGTVSVFNLDFDQSVGELGFRVLPSARRRGVARWAARAAARYAFGELGLRRLQLFHAVENEASCRVASATAFRWEGTLRESYRYGDGRWHDEHLHARLASD